MKVGAVLSSGEFSLRDTIVGQLKTAAQPVATVGDSIEEHLREISTRIKILDVGTVERSEDEPHTLRVCQWVKVQAIFRNGDFKGLRVAAPEDLEQRMIPYKRPKTPGGVFNYEAIVEKVREFVELTKDYVPPTPKVRKERKKPEAATPVQAEALVTAAPTQTDVPVDPPVVLLTPPAPTVPTRSDDFLPPGMAVERDLSGEYKVSFKYATIKGGAVTQIVDSLKKILLEN